MLCERIRGEASYVYARGYIRPFAYPVTRLSNCANQRGERITACKARGRRERSFLSFLPRDGAHLLDLSQMVHPRATYGFWERRTYTYLCTYIAYRAAVLTHARSPVCRLYLRVPEIICYLRLFRRASSRECKQGALCRLKRRETETPVEDTRRIDRRYLFLCNIGVEEMRGDAHIQASPIHHPQMILGLDGAAIYS